MHQGRGGTTEQRVKRGEREWHGCTTHTHAHVHAHTEKFIPENRGCVSTSMAAGRSMHSPPPELTDAGRRGGQPLHARCHRNALSLKHRLIITDARPFSLSLSLSSAAIFTPPLGYPVGEPGGCYNPLSVSHRVFLPSSFALSFSRPSSLLFPRAHFAFPATGTLSTFLVLSYLLAGSGRVRDDGVGGDRATSPFALQATFSRSNYYRTAS